MFTLLKCKIIKINKKINSISRIDIYLKVEHMSNQIPLWCKRWESNPHGNAKGV